MFNDNVMKGTSWVYIETSSYEAEDGNTYEATETYTLHFETDNTGKMIDRFVSAIEENEQSISFQYSFIALGTRGTITIAADSYDFESNNDEELILHGDDGIQMVFSRMRN